MGSTNQAGEVSEVGIAPRFQSALELCGRTDQDGMSVAHYGYLAHIHGLPLDELFSVPGLRSETAARFTFSGSGIMKLHHDRGGTMAQAGVVTTETSGELSVYFNMSPGGDFGDPSSFARGELVGTFSIRYHSTLNEDFHNRNLGFISVAADLVQTSGKDFLLNGCPHRLGRLGLQLRAALAGKGWLTDRRTLRSYNFYGGTLMVVN